MIKVFLYGVISAAIINGIFYLINLPRKLKEKAVEPAGWSSRDCRPDANAQIDNITLERLDKIGIAAEQRYTVMFTDGYYFSFQRTDIHAVNQVIKPDNLSGAIPTSLYWELVNAAKKAHENAVLAAGGSGATVQEQKETGLCNMSEEEFRKLPAWKRVELQKAAEAEKETH